MPISARVTFSDGRSARITGETREEIQNAVQEVEAQIAQKGEQQPAQEQPAPAPEGSDSGGNTVAGKQLTDTQQKQIESLQELARTNPDQRDSAMQQIAMIRGEQGLGYGDLAKGVAETGISAVVNTVGQAAAGIRGLWHVATGSGSLSQRMDEAANLVRHGMRSVHYAPHSRGGQEMERAIGGPMRAYEQGVEWVATHASFGNPVAATAIYTGLLAAPMVAGARTGFIERAGARATAAEHAARLRSVADELGIDIEGVGWRERVPQAAREAVAGRGERLTDIQASLKTQERAADAKVDALYAQAREMNASVRGQNLANLGGDMRRELNGRGFDLENLPELDRRLTDFENIQTKLPGYDELQNGLKYRDINLRTVDILRQRLNQALKEKNLSSREASGINHMKNRLNRFMDEQADLGLMSGDPEAMAQWKLATNEAARYHEQFSANRVISNMIKNEATPQMVRNWITGASETIPKADALLVVNRLRDVFGEGSPEMMSIRAEMMDSLMEPLTRSNPNFHQFVDGVDRFVRKNRPLADELGFDTSQVAAMREMVGAFEKYGADTFWDNINPHTVVARFMIGHSIARHGALVQLGAATLRTMTGRFLGGRRRAILGELVGRDLHLPLIPKSTVAAAGYLTGEALDNAGQKADPQTITDLVTNAATARAAQENPVVTNDPSGGGIMRNLTGTSNENKVNLTSAGSEGFAPFVYDDKRQTRMPTPIKPSEAVGNPTIGHGLMVSTIENEKLNEAIGRSVQDIVTNGVTPTESRKMVASYVAKNERRLLQSSRGDTFAGLKGQRREAVRELAYWAGVEGALGFHNMWQAIEDGNYRKAAAEMIDSATYRRGNRGMKNRMERLARMMREG